ncbi:hypothetical protein D3C72_1831260 [compost metagenome]
MGKVAAHPDLLDQCVYRRGVRVGCVGGERHVPLHPVADGLYAAVPLPKRPKLVGRKAQQSVGLAVAAGVDVTHHLLR